MHLLFFLLFSDTVLLIGGYTWSYLDTVKAVHVPSKGYACSRRFPNLPSKMSYTQAFWLNGQITVCGGNTKSGQRDTCLVFDEEMWAWKVKSSWPEKLAYHYAFQKDDGNIITAGGKPVAYCILKHMPTSYCIKIRCTVLPVYSNHSLSGREAGCSYLSTRQII